MTTIADLALVTGQLNLPLFLSLSLSLCLIARTCPSRSWRRAESRSRPSRLRPSLRAPVPVVQSDRSGRRLPRSGFRSHRTGGDSGGNKESLKKKPKRGKEGRSRSRNPQSSMVIPKGNLCAITNRETKKERRWSLSLARYHHVCGSNASLAAVSRGLRRRSRFSLLPSLLREGDGTPVRAYHRVLSETGFRWMAIMYANGHCAARRKGERPLSERARCTNRQTRHLTFTFDA